MNLAEGVQLVSFGILGADYGRRGFGHGSALQYCLLGVFAGLVFISISGLYILLNAGFVAAAQVLVYVGAVNVLILFGIMLVNKEEDFAPVNQAWLGKATTGAVCAGIFGLIGTMVCLIPWAISNELRRVIWRLR